MTDLLSDPVSIINTVVERIPERTSVVYEPDRTIKLGFVAQSREMVDDLLKSRQLIWRLFLRDFHSKYRQSIFGLAWVIVNPLVAISVFAYLNSAGILSIGSTNVPYVAFAVVGLTIWNLFAVGLNAGTTSIINAGSMVAKINFPKVSLVLAATGQSLIEFGVRLMLSAVILIVFKVVPAWTVIFLPLALIPLWLLTVGLALILSLLAGVFRDIAQVISLLTTFLMFLLPVLYPTPKAGLAAKVFALNPLGQLVVGPRDLVFNGYFSDPAGFFFSSIFSIFVFLIFWRLFHLAETKIAERI